MKARAAELGCVVDDHQPIVFAVANQVTGARSDPHVNKVHDGVVVVSFSSPVLLQISKPSEDYASLT